MRSIASMPARPSRLPLAVSMASPSAAIRVSASKACDHWDLERGRYIRTEERRARFESRLVDLAKQRAESVSRQMACEGFGVKVIGLESKANDFLGQLIERRI